MNCGTLFFNLRSTTLKIFIKNNMEGTDFKTTLVNSLSIYIPNIKTEGRTLRKWWRTVDCFLKKSKRAAVSMEAFFFFFFHITFTSLTKRI